MSTDIEIRFSRGHGKPMLGTRWALGDHAGTLRDVTYSHLIAVLRGWLMALRRGDRITITITRELHG